MKICENLAALDVQRQVEERTPVGSTYIRWASSNQIGKHSASAITTFMSNWTFAKSTDADISIPRKATSTYDYQPTNGCVLGKLPSTTRGFFITAISLFATTVSASPTFSPGLLAINDSGFLIGAYQKPEHRVRYNGFLTGTHTIERTQSGVVIAYADFTSHTNTSIDDSLGSQCEDVNEDAGEFSLVTGCDTWIMNDETWNQSDSDNDTDQSYRERHGFVFYAELPTSDRAVFSGMSALDEQQLNGSYYLLGAAAVIVDDDPEDSANAWFFGDFALIDEDVKYINEDRETLGNLKGNEFTIGFTTSKTFVNRITVSLSATQTFSNTSFTRSREDVNNTTAEFSAPQIKVTNDVNRANRTGYSARVSVRIFSQIYLHVQKQNRSSKSINASLTAAF